MDIIMTISGICTQEIVLEKAFNKLYDGIRTCFFNYQKSNIISILYAITLRP